MNEGHLFSNGRCFDIGNTTRYSLERFKETGLVDTDKVDPYTSGNGSIMRLAPVPMFYGSDPQLALTQSGESSKTTHGAVTAVDACRYFGGLIYGALNGASKASLLSDRYSPIEGYWDKHPLCREIDEVTCGSYRTKNPPEIRGTGYVVESLEAALWLSTTPRLLRKDVCML